MAALIIPNHTSFGAMTNRTVSQLLSLNTSVERLKDALATASAGYNGVPGTEFEAASMGMNIAQPNNFGIAPDPETPGAAGTDYRFAVDTLAGHWATFWLAASAAIEQLDNGAG